MNVREFGVLCLQNRRNQSIIGTASIVMSSFLLNDLTRFIAVHIVVRRLGENGKQGRMHHDDRNLRV